MATDQVLEGGCLCGAVRYRAAGKAKVKALCHCRSCRLAAGGTSVAWVVMPAAGFAWADGAEPQRFESSPGVERTFCGRCGTSLTYAAERRVEWIDVTSASLDAPEAGAPTLEIWTSERLSWSPPNPALPQYERGSAPAPVQAPEPADCG